MKEIVIGMVSGIVSGTGMGGGTVLILFLSVFMNISQHKAQATNLIFFIPTSISAIIGNINQGLIKWKIGINIAIFGSVGAAIGASIASKMNVQELRKYFGIFLLFITIYEIYSYAKLYIFKPKKT